MLDEPLAAYLGGDAMAVCVHARFLRHGSSTSSGAGSPSGALIHRNGRSPANKPVLAPVLGFHDAGDLTGQVASIAATSTTGGARRLWGHLAMSNIGVSEWDFFVSYTAADRGWAEWIAWELEEAGHRVLFQAWDFVPGSHWTSRMREGIGGAKRTLAILSPDYLNSVYGQAEWEAAYRADPRGFARKLIPIRVRDCPRPDLLGGIVSFDLFDRGADEARQLLHSRIEEALTGRAKPAVAPAFPGNVVATPPPSPPSTTPPAFPGRHRASTTEAPTSKVSRQTHNSIDPAQNLAARQSPQQTAGQNIAVGAVLAPTIGDSAASSGEILSPDAQEDCLSNTLNNGSEDLTVSRADYQSTTDAAADGPQERVSTTSPAGSVDTPPAATTPERAAPALSPKKAPWFRGFARLRIAGAVLISGAAVVAVVNLPRGAPQDLTFTPTPKPSESQAYLRPRYSGTLRLFGAVDMDSVPPKSGTGGAKVKEQETDLKAWVEEGNKGKVMLYNSIPKAQIPVGVGSTVSFRTASGRLWILAVEEIDSKGLLASVTVYENE